MVSIWSIEIYSTALVTWYTLPSLTRAKIVPAVSQHAAPLRLLSLKLLRYHKRCPAHMWQGSMQIIFPDRLLLMQGIHGVFRLIFWGRYDFGILRCSNFASDMYRLLWDVLLGCIWSWMIITMRWSKEARVSTFWLLSKIKIRFHGFFETTWKRWDEQSIFMYSILYSVYWLYLRHVS